MLFLIVYCTIVLSSFRYRYAFSHAHIHTQTPCLPLHALFLSLMGVLDKIGLLQTTHLYSCWMKEQISDWGPL